MASEGLCATKRIHPPYGRPPTAAHEPRRAPGSPVGGQARTVVVDEHALYDSIIEVIDPERRVVVRSQRFAPRRSAPAR